MLLRRINPIAVIKQCCAPGLYIYNCFLCIETKFSIAMRKETITKCLGFIVVLMFLLMGITSCEYEFVEIDEPDPDIPVSFAEDIVPVFTANSNCTACHRTGATSPDLSAANAYNSIVPGLINADNPELSRIYTVPSPASSHPSRYTPIQAARLLTWIKQGAQNN